MSASVIKLNLGGCEKLDGGANSPPLVGFLHVDINLWDGVNVVCDIRDLSNWEDNSVEEIRASHVIEHFNIEEIPAMLKEWYRVLTYGGLLRIYCPDAHIIASRYVNSEVTIEEFSDLLFGRQSYKENLHRVALNRERLDALVDKAGFFIVGRKPRPNAYPYDLGVQAVKSKY